MSSGKYESVLLPHTMALAVKRSRSIWAARSCVRSNISESLVFWESRRAQGGPSSEGGNVPQTVRSFSHIN